jgi:hypothetical protein
MRQLPAADRGSRDGSLPPLVDSTPERRSILTVPETTDDDRAVRVAVLERDDYFVVNLGRKNTASAPSAEV